MAPEDRNLLIAERWWDQLPRPIYAELEKLPCREEWFEVYRIAERIFALYEPGQFEEAISTLIVGAEKAALIDTGCGIGNIRAAVEEFTDLPVMVVNTHAHNDHVAQNYLFDDVAMFDHPLSHDVSKNGLPNSKMAHLVAPGMVWKPLPAGFDVNTYWVPPFKVTRWLKDQDQIDLGGRVLEVLHTPGHSPDSICLLDRDARLLFTGDMFYTGQIYTYLPGGDLSTFIQSYRRLMEYYDHFDRLMPSHNEPWVEKELLKDVLQAVETIKAGGGEYIEGTDRGTPIRKYNYARFSIITKVD
jgi:glyoxylase-like metal-dependent hydrolase (beta-lactamase superfamily II)